MLNTYFENVSEKIGDLYLEKELFVFEYEPIVFICNDSAGKKYFCVCDDIIEQQSWIVTEISLDILKKILRNDIRIMDVFIGRQVLCIDFVFETNEYIYNWYNYSDIPEDELPVSNQYLIRNKYTDAYLESLESKVSFKYQLSPKNDFLTKNDHLISVTAEYVEKDSQDVVAGTAYYSLPENKNMFGGIQCDYDFMRGLESESYIMNKWQDIEEAA